jgi:hypothetical protein
VKADKILPSSLEKNFPTLKLNRVGHFNDFLKLFNEIHQSPSPITVQMAPKTSLNLC